MKAKANMAALKAHHASFFDEQTHRAKETAKAWKNIRSNQKHVRHEVGYYLCYTKIPFKLSCTSPTVLSWSTLWKHLHCV